MSEGTLFGKERETKPRDGERMQDNHTVAPYLDIPLVFIREALPNNGLTPINLHMFYFPLGLLQLNLCLILRNLSVYHGEGIRQLGFILKVNSNPFLMFCNCFLTKNKTITA